jgi:molybdate transport system substrate-binding protein
MSLLKVFSTNAVNAALCELVPVFERDSGNQVTVDFYPTNQLLERVKDGEKADVAIATAAGIDELTDLGKIIAGTRADLGSSGVGVGVRAGAPHPDISTVAAFKRALLDAESIAYASRGVGGILLTKLAARFDMTELLQTKARTRPGGLIGELVVQGEAELCVQMISEILAVKGCELVGPFPPGLQQVTMFAAGILDSAKQVDAARTLIEFLTSPAAARVMKSRGLEPPKR